MNDADRPATKGPWSLFAVAIAASAVLLTRSAHAEDLFEIQVFHARVNPTYRPGLELHSNWVPRGAASTASGEASTQGVLFEMVEPTFGVGHAWEVGAHIQQSVRPDGTIDWGGIKLRTMTLLVDGPRAPFRLAINVEGGYQPARIDAARWGTEVRPVVEWVVGGFDLDVNPIIAFTWRGEHAGIPQLQPAVSARHMIADTVAPGVEYYAQLGAVTDPSPSREQRHYVFGTADVVRWSDWILHFGVGRGLTDASSRWIVASIVGHIF